MRKNKTFKIIRKLFFSKYVIIINVFLTIFVLLYDFFYNLYVGQNISYMYIINFVVYTKRYFILFMPSLFLILLIVLFVLEKRYFKKEFKKYFIFLFAINMPIAGFVETSSTEFIFSLADDYFVQVSEVECTESQDNVECGDYYFAFDRPLDIKDAKSVQAFFERG